MDFLIGDYAIEIDSHPQDVGKNRNITDAGYNMIHFNSWEIKNEPWLSEWLITIWQEQDSSRLMERQ